MRRKHFRIFRVRKSYGGMLLLLLIVGLLLQAGLVYATRWYLHRLYGRHFDRLEAALSKLRG